MTYPSNPRRLLHYIVVTRAFAILTATLALAAAQDVPEPLTSDFTPPRGAIRTRDKEEGAWQKRLLTATSTDGLTFTRTNQIVTDQANVPDLVMDPRGRLYLYYSGGTVGDRSNVIAVAISDDQGKTWAFKYVEIDGGGRMAPPGDPDIRILDDGTFRLYFTAGAAGARVPNIFYAEGRDGIHFIFQGPAFAREGQVIIDSFTFPAGGLWHMYTLSETEQLWYATSEDGKSFTAADRPRLTANGRPYLPTNEIVLDDGRIRAYAFTPGNRGDIRSFLTSDGRSWEAEQGIRLAVDPENGLESDFVKDAAVIRLTNGTYLMVYVTVIPK
jgi:hypothetical protein